MTLVQVQLQKQTASQRAKGEKFSQTTSSHTASSLDQPVPPDCLSRLNHRVIFLHDGPGSLWIFLKNHQSSEDWHWFVFAEKAEKSMTDNISYHSVRNHSTGCRAQVPRKLVLDKEMSTGQNDFSQNSSFGAPNKFHRLLLLHIH